MENSMEQIIKRIKEKEEILRKLKMVKLHRAKHNTTELENLIKEWLGVCQQTLQDLEQKLKDQSSDSADIGIPKILEHLNIEPELVGYSIEDEMFTN
uniref:Swi5-dependent recombination DNA repair protein 1 homolog n=1 Tax=Daphnia galeata TaxID=27404 RepID=A0A8J2RXZ1_9CRUS|nr:unnamed protein product [Daphnia galeata]